MKNSKSLIKLFFAFAITTACESNSEPETKAPTPIPIASNFKVTDTANEGNSTDIKIAFNLTGEIGFITTSKLIISKASKTVTPSQIETFKNDQFTEFTPKNTVEIQLTKILKDTDGDLIKENLDYVVHLVLSNKDQSLLTPSVKSFQLKNETLVTTLVENIAATEDISIDADLNLYVNGGAISNEKSSNVFKVTPKGAISILTNEVSQPVGNTFDNQGNLLVTLFGTNSIYKVAPNGTQIQIVNDSRFFGGGGIIVLKDGTILNTFWAARKIFKIAKDLSISEINIPINGFIGFTHDKENDIPYLGNFNNGKIFKLETDNTLTEIADTPASIGHISYANKHFYVTGFEQHKIYKVGLDGTIVEEIGTGVTGSSDGLANTATFQNPNGIEATPDGKIVYTTGADLKIRKIILKR